jgi:CRISPR system Cascade subunit CasD
MSTEKRFLTLQLKGPLQSWGFDSQYSRRNTGLMPTKSGIAGLCCAALGYVRGGEEEQSFLSDFRNVRMTAIAIPRKREDSTLPVRRLQDYHTVQNTVTADGKPKETHLTYRQYLLDAGFGVILEGNNSLLMKIAYAIAQPRWGLWLGRKSCIPSVPVLPVKAENPAEAVQSSRDGALRLLIGDAPVEAFTRQEEVDEFADGKDSLPDTPVSFADGARSFSPRRIRLIMASQ